MVEIRYRNLNPPAESMPDSVRSRRVQGPDGRRVTVYTVDADSPSFADGLAFLFRKNVAKARRENKRLLGSPDGLPAKT